MNLQRGDGVGLEVSDSFVRGVRLRHDAPGRIAAATELPFLSYEDGPALDALTMMRAELGEPVEPTRLATFPSTARLQRIDVTGRSGPELNQLRSTLNRRRGVNSSLVMDDGPRRWLLAIEWDEVAIRRLEDLAERAGFVDVTVEPSPLALARVVPASTTYIRRLVDQGDVHHAVLAHGFPVAAAGTSATGRPPPDTDTSDVDIPLAWFDEFLDAAELAETINRVSSSADARTAFLGTDPVDDVVVLDVAGDRYPDFPAHDLRSPQRQSVALGAAAGAAGLAGPLRPVDMNVQVVVDAPDFDRPWAIERLSDLPSTGTETTIGPLKKMTRRLRPRHRSGTSR